MIACHLKASLRYAQARLNCILAWQELLSQGSFREGEAVEDEANDFVQARRPAFARSSSLFTQALLCDVGGTTAIERLCTLVQAGEERCRVMSTPVVILPEVFVRGKPELRLSMERNEQTALAECLLFGALLRDKVTQSEVAAVLSTLQCLPLETQAFEPTSDALPVALPVFFGALALLQNGELNGPALLAHPFFAGADAESAGARAALRFAVGMNHRATAVMRHGADQGCFAYLLSALEMAPRQHNWFVHVTHELFARLIDDLRGREVVNALMSGAGEPAACQLLALAAHLYATGPDDLSLYCPKLWEFVEFVGGQAAGSPSSRSATLWVPFLALLRALSRVHPEEVWVRLHAPGPVHPADWLLGDCVADALLRYAEKYAAEAGRLPGSGPGDSVMPAEDLDVLCAYLGVLQELGEGAQLTPPRAALLSVRFSGATLDYLLFSLLSVAVPPRLKASVFELLGALAGDGSSALRVWKSLEEARVVRRGGEPPGGEPPGRGDLAFTLCEVEGRAEAYPETLAFLRLAARLARLCAPSRTGPAAGGGAGAGHVVSFARDAVFVGLDGRNYALPHQKWDLAAACLALFHTALQLGGDAPGDTPGGALLRDFESDGPALRRTLSLLAGGAERVLADRAHPHGAAAEACVCGALEVLACALGVSPAWHSRTRPHPHAAQLMRPASRLDALLQRDRRRLRELLSFCGAGGAPQAAALRLLRALDERSPLMASQLDAATSAALRADCGDALAEGLRAALDGYEPDAAPAILTLIAASLARPAAGAQPPLTLAHLLLGFEAGVTSDTLALGGGAAACLDPILDAVATLAAAPAPDGWVEHVEPCLALLCELAADARTRGAVAPFLRARVDIAAASSALAAAAYSSPRAAAAAMHCRAALLRLTTLLVHGAPSDSDDTPLLAALFAPPASPLLRAVAASASSPPAPAPSSSVVGDSAESATQLHPACGSPQFPSLPPLPLIDVEAMDGELRARGVGDEGALSSALGWGLARNHAARAAAAAHHLLAAAAQLLLLCLVRRGAALRGALEAVGDRGLRPALAEALATLAAALGMADDARAEPLLRATSAALDVFGGDGGDGRPLPPMQPAAAAGLLRLLASFLTRAGRADGVRRAATPALVSLLRAAPRPSSPAFSSELRRSGPPLLASLAPDAAAGDPVAAALCSALLSADADATPALSPHALSLAPPLCALVARAQSAAEPLHAALSLLLALTVRAPAPTLPSSCLAALASCMPLHANPDDATPEDAAALASAVRLGATQFAAQPCTPEAARAGAAFVAACADGLQALLRSSDPDALAAQGAAILLLSELLNQPDIQGMERWAPALDRAAWRFLVPPHGAPLAALRLQALLSIHVLRTAAVPPLSSTLRTGPVTIPLLLSAAHASIRGLEDALDERKVTSDDIFNALLLVLENTLQAAYAGLGRHAATGRLTEEDRANLDRMLAPLSSFLDKTGGGAFSFSALLVRRCETLLRT